MPTSKTDIANGALSLTGQELITDLDTEETEQAIQCRQHYDQCRKDVLTRYPWAFAQKSVSLNAGPTPVRSDFFSNSFILPSDFLSMSFTNLDEGGSPYVIEGTYLLAQFSEVILTYTFDNRIPDTYTPGFRRVLEYILASKICFALTKDRALYKSLFEDYERVYFEEVNREAIQTSRNETYIFDEFIDIRRQSF